MNLKKTVKVFTSTFVGPGPSSYKKRTYRAAVSQRLRSTNLEDPGEVGKIFLNVSKSSDPERLNNICIANVSDQDFISPVIDN
jgi:hypothetical protein